ncbi:MAG: AMP-binding protein, partial [Nitrospiraceae bacterium]|nr:AMP-binding protein [Nitrospiraceae bacterium]
IMEGNRRGTVGRSLPGLSVRVIDPDTGEVLPDEESGLLQIKGPCVMKGYLGMPEKTAEVVQDGWYTTGDIVTVDNDGFIRITDRLARFSKIAGEMVPHTNVEEALHGILDLEEQSLAVAGVPDRTRGERLVVLHTLEDGQLDALLESLAHCDIPNLWRPKPSAFYRIDEIPVLGTGKMDIKAVKALATKLDLGD